MDATTNESSNNYAAENEELKRLCTVFGVRQSNMLYHLLSAKDDAEKLERIKETTRIIGLERGGDKCEAGQIWDEVHGVCV